MIDQGRDFLLACFWGVWFLNELSRSINELFNTICSIRLPKVFFSIILSNKEADSFPISNAGCVMVDKEGESKEAVRKLEKLMILSCWGIFSFISLHT